MLPMLGMINCLELRPMTPTHLHPCIRDTDIFNPGPNQQPDGSATAPERRDFPMNVQSTGYFTGETWAPEKRRDRGTSTYRHTRERERPMTTTCKWVVTDAERGPSDRSATMQGQESQGLRPEPTSVIISQFRLVSYAKQISKLKHDHFWCDFLAF